MSGASHSIATPRACSARVSWSGADLVLVMSPWHLETVEALNRGRCYAEVITEFVGDVSGGVADPLGGSDDHYRGTCAQLERLVEAVLDRLEPGADE